MTAPQPSFDWTDIAPKAVELMQIGQQTSDGCITRVGDSSCDNGWTYNAVTVQGKTRQAHRVVYEFFKGKISPGMEIDHLCNRRACFNPFHLEAVTPTENKRRGNHGQDRRKQKGDR